MRAAIYTRKSTEEGLEQEFNSLDHQRESGEHFVKSRGGRRLRRATMMAGILVATWNDQR